MQAIPLFDAITSRLQGVMTAQTGVHPPARAYWLQAHLSSDHHHKLRQSGWTSIGLTISAARHPQRSRIMSTFRILPANMDADLGWVVETTHASGIVETSIVYETREKAQKAADSWVHLDEDWAKV
jgi:hypothetical protein